jgi:tetratricopeptide (TPR) repeat protein
MLPAHLASLRAAAWDHIGLAQLASVFYDAASELEPSNGLIGMLGLRAAEEADPQAALARARRIADDSFRYPALVVTLAVAMLLLDAERTGTPVDRSHFADLLRITLGRLDLEPSADAGERAQTYCLAAFGFQSLEEGSEALRCYELGLRIAPDNEDLLIGQGMLLYGQDDQRACEAFARAVELSSSREWPYFFLAHYHLLREQFEQALTFCSQAWPRATSDSVRALLLEWSAICQSELSYPDEAVRVLFQRAMALDPTSERIARNLSAFETVRRGATPAKPEVESAQTLKVRYAEQARRVLSRAAA